MPSLFGLNKMKIASLVASHTLKQKYWLNIKTSSDSEVLNYISEIR